MVVHFTLDFQHQLLALFAMNSSLTPRPTVSSKMKWRLGLLLAVAAIALLPMLFRMVSTFSKPTVMQVTLPAKVPGAPTVGVPADALTILIGNDGHLYYYFGAATPTAAASLHATTPAQPIQQVIKEWQQRSKSTIFIKTSAQANYQAMVDLLDEINISGQRSYAVVAATDADRQLLLANGKQ